MKKIVLLLLVSLLFVSCESNSEKTGVFLDEEEFLAHKSMWVNGELKTYQYTFKYELKSGPAVSYIVDVSVNNDNIDFELKEYNGKYKDDLPEDIWTEKENSVKESLGLYDFTIDGLYDFIETEISEAKQLNEEYSGKYYADFEFNFLENSPYISSCVYTSRIIEENLDGNSSSIHIQVLDFKEI